MFSFWLVLKIAVRGLYVGAGLKLFNIQADEIQCKIARAFIGSAGVSYSLAGNEALSSVAAMCLLSTTKKQSVAFVPGLCQVAKISILR